MVRQRPSNVPFDVRDSRAMVSLGPVSTKRFCSYRCPFCYVNTDFLSFGSMKIPEIVGWLKRWGEPFDIIYVSGDTDSFAPPRTDTGLDLLEALIGFGVDLLFTTRAVFREQAQLDRIEGVCSALRRQRKLLFGCESVAQLSHPHLEPRPIPPPEARLEQLRTFHSMGLVSVLAMRPFLPIVDTSEYLSIVDLVKDSIDVVLGEVWYADRGGILERGVFRGDTPTNVPFTEKGMDFDINESVWKVFEAKEIEAAVRAHCQELSIPFFMRSRPAVEWIRAHWQKPVQKAP